MFFIASPLAPHEKVSFVRGEGIQVLAAVGRRWPSEKILDGCPDTGLLVNLLRIGRRWPS